MLCVIQNTKGNELSKDGRESALGVSKRDLTLSEFLNCNVPIDTSTEAVHPLQVLVVNNLIFENRTRNRGSN